VDECGTVRFDLQPYHAMRVVAALWTALALLTWPSISCLLAAALYAVGQWYARTRRISWPADVEDYLAKRGWTRPRRMSGELDRYPPIPFRPLTIPEMYSGAVRIVLRTWPTLLGVPAVIHTGFALGLATIAYLVRQFVGSPQTSAFLLGGDGALRPGTAVLALVVFLSCCAVLFPGDGLLISLGAQAADKAVRGEPIRFNEVFWQATENKLAVCRTIIAYYLIVAATLLIQVAAVFSGFYRALIPLLVVCGIVSAVIAVLLSMAPVVLVLEQLGIADAFRRSIELCRPALGRILLINVVWVAAVTPVLLLATVDWPVLIIVSPVVCGVVRCVHMLAYADLRMRHDDYGQQLRIDWARNMGREGLPGG